MRGWTPSLWILCPAWGPGFRSAHQALKDAKDTRLCEPLSSLLPLSGVPGQSDVHVPLQRQHQKWWCLEAEPRGQAYSECSVHVVPECEVLQEWGWVFFQPPDLARSPGWLCKEGGAFPTMELPGPPAGCEGRERRCAPMWEQGHLLGGDTWPTRRLTFSSLLQRCSPILGPLPSPGCYGNQLSRRTVRQMELPFGKAPLPGFHYSLGLRGALAAWEGRRKGAWVFLPRASLTALGTALHLRPQSPHLQGVVWAGPHFSFTGEGKASWSLWGI